GSDREEVAELGDDHERGHGVNEVAVQELALVDGEGQGREVRRAAYCRDQWRDQVLDKGPYHRGEGDADDDTDCQVDHIATKQERLEASHALLAYDTDRTTFPNCSAASSRVSAASTSANG